MGASFKNIKAASEAAWLKRLKNEDITGIDHAASNDFARLAKNASDVDVEVWRVGTPGYLLLNGEAFRGNRTTKCFNLATQASQADQAFFIADRKYKIHGIKEIHATKSSVALDAAVIKRCENTQAPADGIALTSSFLLTGDNDTLQTCTLVTDARSDGTKVLELNEGDRLAIDYTGTLTALAGLVIMVEMSPGNESETVTFAMNANGDLSDQAFFIANRPMTIVAAKAIHSTLGTNGSAVTFQLTKDTGTDVPGAGTDLLSAAISLKAAINTVQELAFATTPGLLRLAPGDRISIDFAGTLTAVAGLVVTVEIAPMYGRKEVTYNLNKNGNMVDEAFFIADRDYEIVAVQQYHTVAGNDGSPVSLQLTVDGATPTDAPGAGDNILSTGSSAGFNLKATAATVQTGTFISVLNNYLLAGDRLSVDYAGTLTTLSGVVVTVSLKPV